MSNTRLRSRTKPDVPDNETLINQKVETARNQRNAGRSEGRTYAEEVINRDVQGLAPEKRHAMQYEANKQVQRGMQSANRKLLGDQSRRGIVGKGGVAYAQQRDIQRLGNEAQGQANRDLDKLDSDLALKKLAAMFNIEQGEATQAQLDRQMAIDELNLDYERKRQQKYEDKYNRQFSRI